MIPVISKSRGFKYFSMCQYQNVTVVRFEYYNVTITWEYTYPSLVCSTVLPLFNCIFTKICCFLNSVYLLRTDKNSNIIVLNNIVGGQLSGGQLSGGQLSPTR